MVSIENSVGRAGENKPVDVRKIKNRFAELGFKFFNLNGEVDAGLMMAIRLYQSIIHGKSRVEGVDGRIDPGALTIQYLNSIHTPHWQLMPAEGDGFVNDELKDVTDNHDYGTSWMAQVIINAGRHYHDNYLSANSNAALLTVNDVSIPQGGDTADHSGHETGLSCDLRLPRLDGEVGGIKNPNTNLQYDSQAMQAQLIALQSQPQVRKILFNDEILVSRGLCQRATGHGDHVHFELSPISLS